MQQTLFCDVGTRTLSDRQNGTNFTFPTVQQGDALSLSLRFVKKINGEAVETSLDVAELRAAIGRVDTPPESGHFRLRLGEDTPVDGVNVTEVLAANITATRLAEALNALSGIGEFGVATVELDNGSYLIRFEGGTSAVPIVAHRNSLFPLSFVRAREYLFDSRWVHEIRLVQAPIAFTNNSERVLPPPPTVERVQAGGSSGGAEWNEIQRLIVPPSFRGAYQLRRGSKKSTLLSRADGPTEIELAIVGLADEGGKLTVTNPVDGEALIEFGGDMEAASYDPLGVEVFSSPEGDLTLHLDLNTVEAQTLLRRDATVKLPIEIEADVRDADNDEIIRTVTLYRGEITVTRDLAYDELGTPANIDWLRPPLRASYVPFTPDQIITGAQHYVETFGDGVAFDFEIDHNLGTSAIHVSVRENGSGNAMLVNGVDYTVTVDGDDTISLSILGGGDAPEVGSLAIIVTSAGPVSAFQAHTHTIGQIVGLQTILDGLGTRLDELEALAPSGAISADENESGGTVAEWTLPKIFEVFPSSIESEIEEGSALVDIKPASLPKVRGLWSAVHDVDVESSAVLGSVTPAAAPSFRGRVFVNSGTTALYPTPAVSAKTRRAITVEVGEHIACDGRQWYKVKRETDTEETWYPEGYDRTLFELYVDEKQLRLKRQFSVSFGFEAALIGSNSSAQWVLVIELGSTTSEASPATTGLNLKAITWDTTPVLSHRIVLTPTSCSHRFGIRVNRQLVGGLDTLSLDKIYYGTSEGGTAPASANFAVRARLVRFDMADSESAPKGLVALRGLNVGGESVGVARIQ